jgi:hypothetical protein
MTKDNTGVMEFKLWLESEHVDDVIDDFCNVLVEVADGRRYGLNVWTFGFFRSAVEEGDPAAPADLREKYLVAPDLFIAELDRALVESVVGDLLERGCLPQSCLLPPEPGDR